MVACTGPDSLTRYDHMWVMYKNEVGRWTLIEPLILTGAEEGKTTAPSAPPQSPPQVQSAAYVPEFLFNDSHLWIVKAKAESRHHR